MESADVAFYAMILGGYLYTVNAQPCKSLGSNLCAELCEQWQFHFQAQIPCESTNKLSAQQPWK